MLKTKYIFLKKLYPNDVIVFLKKERYFVLFDDLYLLKSFEKKGIIKNLEKCYINYIILDNLVMVKRKTFTNNNYLEYLYKGIFIDFIKKGRM